MKKFVTECVVALLMLIATVSHAQNPTTMGTSFAVSYLMTRASSETHYLSFMSDTLTTVWIQNPNTGWIDSVQVQPNTEHRFTVPNNQVYQNQSSVVGNYGLLINSQYPISVYSYIYAYDRMDGTVVLPISKLGCQYVVNTYPVADDYPSRSSNDRCEFVVMAVSEKSNGSSFNIDTTIVDIYLSDSTSDGDSAGTHKVVYLASGQTYKLFSLLHDGDFSGTVVQSRNGKKIAVFSGDQVARVSTTDAGGDHLYTQLYPTNTWGTEFVVAQSLEDGNAFVRVTSLFDNCQIRQNGNLLATINKYETYEFVISGFSVVSTSKPAEVLRCLPSRTSFGYGEDWGDAAFSVAIPFVQGSSRAKFSTYPFGTRDYYQPHYYLEVVTRMADTASIMLDGDSVSGFSVSQGYAYKLMNISSGYHYLYSTTDSRFVATTYGTDENWGGYIFNVNGNADAILDLQEYVDVIVPEELMSSSDTIVICQNALLQLSMNMDCDSVVWTISDGTTIVANELSHLFAGAGNYEVSARAYLSYPYSMINASVTKQIFVRVDAPDTILAVQGTCDPYMIFDGHIYTETTDILIGVRPNESGCDTLEVLRIEFYPSFDTTMYVEMPAGTEYQWIDGNIYNHNNNSASYMLRTMHGCDSLVRLNLTFWAEGIDDVDCTMQLSPNPAKDMVKIVSSVAVQNVSVYDMGGKEVRRHICSAPTTEIDMDLSALPIDAYIVLIQTDKGYVTRKLILQ